MSDERVYGVRWFVPGTPATLDGWEGSLRRAGLALEGEALRIEGSSLGPLVEWIENDGSFGDAFGFGTVTEEERRAIDRAGSALVLDSPGYLATGRRDVARLLAALGDAGALGARLEQSKLGWSIAHWVRVLGGDDPWALYRSTVVVLESSGSSGSCGMHAFGLPDARVKAPRDEANRLLGALNVFQLTEDPVLVTGDTFSPDRETPRRRLERWPDDGYPRGHACHNPFGTWRLGPEGGTADGRGELRPVHLPALVVLLTAAERKAGRRLLREEVERMAAEGACVMMAHADVKSLERSRGYADLEPELAWEQWKLLRGAGR